jgi:hypothetical protein
VKISELSVAQFLDLTHHYVLTLAKAEDHDKINKDLIGVPLTSRPVDEQAGFTPPSWWKGDEYASRSGIVATTTMRR